MPTNFFLYGGWHCARLFQTCSICGWIWRDWSRISVHIFLFSKKSELLFIILVEEIQCIWTKSSIGKSAANGFIKKWPKKSSINMNWTIEIWSTIGTISNWNKLTCFFYSKTMLYYSHHLILFTSNVQHNSMNFSPHSLNL